MIISIGSYKVRVEILVAIIVVFWIMFGHLLCGCCKMNLFEGFREGLTANTLAYDFKKAEETLKKAEETLKKAGKEVMNSKEQVNIAIERLVKQNCEYDTVKKKLEQAKAQAQELYQIQKTEQAAVEQAAAAERAAQQAAREADELRANAARQAAFDAAQQAQQAQQGPQLQTQN